MKKMMMLLFTLAALLALLCASAQAGSESEPCPTCGDTMMGWGYSIADDPGMGVPEGPHHARECCCCQSQIPVYYACEVGNEATCTSGAKCKFCHQTLIAPLGHDWQAEGGFPGKAATCTEPAVCGRCGEEYGTALGHDWQAKGNFTGKAATCTEPAVCGRCGEQYGTSLGLEHNWQKKSVVSPACGRAGYTLYTCLTCGDNYYENYTSPLSHYYGIWTPQDESSHQAVCLRSGCLHQAVRDCDVLTFTLDDGEVSLCPVCGRVENSEALTFVSDAKAAAVDGQLPRGELALYMGKLPNGSTALTVAFEYNGKLVQPKGRVKVTLPLAALGDLTGVRLLAYGLGSDGAAQTLTAFDGEIPLSVDGETVSFEVDFTCADAAPAQLLLLTAQ